MIMSIVVNVGSYVDGPGEMLGEDRTCVLSLEMFRTEISTHSSQCPNFSSFHFSAQLSHR